MLGVRKKLELANQIEILEKTMKKIKFDSY